MRGDVISRTNAQGQVIHVYRYGAFGSELTSPQNSAESNNPFRFAGEYWDAHTQTYYLRARHFNPRTGRFTQLDPHWTIENMIWGDEPIHLNEREINLLAQQLRMGNPFSRHSSTMVPDVLAILQSGNLFMYVMHNPVMFIDPTGLLGICGVTDKCKMSSIEGGGKGMGGLSGSRGGTTRVGGTLRFRPTSTRFSGRTFRVSRGSIRGVTTGGTQSQSQTINIAGRGHTGRIEASSLNEQLAMQEVLSNPLDGARDLSLGNRPLTMTDARWLATDGWVKMSRNVNGVEIHFVYNTITGVFDDFKFAGGVY